MTTEEIPTELSQTFESMVGEAYAMGLSQREALLAIPALLRVNSFVKNNGRNPTISELYEILSESLGDFSPKNPKSSENPPSKYP